VNVSLIHDLSSAFGVELAGLEIILRDIEVLNGRSIVSIGFVEGLFRGRLAFA
jgi:hypothetical protein